MFLDFFSEFLSGYIILIGIWVIALIIALISLFKRTDISRSGKALWAVILLVAPGVGLICYLILGLSKRKKLLDVEKKLID